MVLNYIWIGFFVIGFVVALFRFAGYFFRDFLLQAMNLVFDQADRDIFQTIIQNIFQSAKTSVEISIYLIGVMTLWLGVMKIGERGGAVEGMSKLVGPFFNRLFPRLPKNHPVMGSMLMNFCANMLGLDNAATAACGAQNPTDVFIPLLIATYCATIVGMIYVSIVQKIRFFQPVILAYILGITALIAGLIFYLQSLPPEKVSVFSSITGNMLLFLVIIVFLYMGIRKKVNLYETFIEGAKEGFTVAVKIIPYLVAMLVAIGVFRASGAMDFLLLGLGRFFALFGFDTEFVKALPVALMKPLSGGGARGLMVETMKTYGADSFPGFLSCIFQGSTETTFYVIAVYFGSVNIRKTRYAVPGGLIADLAGVLAAIFVAYLFYKG
ncbi:MAG: nucleoside recognition domain protein [Bacteroidetes bacterium]|nr:nucleoside recognition domain protein [Bacteroidota bacterium]